MSRTIAEIQNEILDEKREQSALAGLTNQSKTAIWKLWVYIVASAIWVHEQIVERNARISRPHTLDWYRTQALGFIDKTSLIFKDGFFEFDTEELSEVEIESKRIVKHCAVSEIDLATILNPDGELTIRNDSGDRVNVEVSNSDADQLLSNYFRNQVGVVFMKVAKDDGENITSLKPDEQARFREYINRIKDAGNQVQVSSFPGDKLELNLLVYVDPLIIFINPSSSNDEENGVLLANGTNPVVDAINNYLRNIEFNGAIVKTFLVDAIQQAPGVNIPLLQNMKAGKAMSTPVTIDGEFYIPDSGYVDLNELQINVTYLPYTFFRNNQNIF
ncbi:hypothetical protein [Dokdonia sp.]|uniref:hypothetical protein n=1 Tax=Dokdonia sp. TaxID=2024995 RepID=UPI003264B1A6